MINNEEAPFYLCSVFLGDRVRINSVNIESGIIIVDMRVHGPGDGLCCPSAGKIARYKLSGDKLIEESI